MQKLSMDRNEIDMMLKYDALSDEEIMKLYDERNMADREDLIENYSPEDRELYQRWLETQPGSFAHIVKTVPSDSLMAAAAYQFLLAVWKQNLSDCAAQNISNPSADVPEFPELIRMLSRRVERKNAASLQYMQEDADQLEMINSYIRETNLPEVPNLDFRLCDFWAIVSMVERDGLDHAIALAYDYGQAKGYRQAKAEAARQKAGENNTDKGDQNHENQN